jgi:two-component system sensor histidine kinase KdpD
MATEIRRKTPEELLRDIQGDAPLAKKGYLKIFLGYASGVGKSFRMLDEARRRRERGQDVIVGAIQPKMAPEAESLLKKLEVFPLKRIDQRFAIDLDALLRRQPAVCVIDGLAYDNPPGSRNPTRWQDVQELLHAGIKVITSINLQHVSELQDQIEKITGKRPQETVPVSLIKSADEIELVDAPPEEPIERTHEEQVDFRKRQQRLSKLRELALVLAADVVDHQLQKYLEQHGITQQFGTHERILVCITPRSKIQEMIETARTIAEKFHGELFAAYVSPPNISPSEQAALDENLEIARSAGAEIEILDGDDEATAILDFARSRGITQLFIGHSHHSGLAARLWGDPVAKLIRRSRGMDVRVFPQ